MHGVADEPAIRARGLSVRYGATVALEDVDLTVDPGELVALVGTNGAGKSSLLRALVGLVRHDGEVVLHGRSCGRRARANVAFVPQEHDIDRNFPITVGQLVATGRRPFVRLGRRLSAGDRHAIAGAVARVGLDGLETKPLSALSGGQLQRALLARALAQDADVLLLDEPLTGLDVPGTAALLDVLSDLCVAGAAALVCVHDLAVVRERFKRCVAVQRTVVGDGKPSRVLDAAGLERMVTCSTG